MKECQPSLAKWRGGKERDSLLLWCVNARVYVCMWVSQKDRLPARQEKAEEKGNESSDIVEKSDSILLQIL